MGLDPFFRPSFAFLPIRHVIIVGKDFLSHATMQRKSAGEGYYGNGQIDERDGDYKSRPAPHPTPSGLRRHYGKITDHDLGLKQA